MLGLTPASRVYLVVGVTDMRKSFNGLHAIVKQALKKDPLTGHFFVFANRRRDRIKVFYWDRSGFWVCAKRLQKGTFFWPAGDTRSVQVTHEELALLLGGLDLSQTRKRRWYDRVGE